MDLNDALIRSHRNNLARYRRLLATHLTELERDYINRRIAEERDALQQLLNGVSREKGIATRAVRKGEHTGEIRV